MTEIEGPVNSQSHQIAAFNNVALQGNPAREVGELIVRQLGKNGGLTLSQITNGVDRHSIASLAIDTLAGGNARVMIDSLNAGAEIDINILARLSSAIAISRRRKTDPLDEYNKLEQKRK